MHRDKRALELHARRCARFHLGRLPELAHGWTSREFLERRRVKQFLDAKLAESTRKFVAAYPNTNTRPERVSIEVRYTYMESTTSGDVRIITSTHVTPLFQTYSTWPIRITSS